MNRTADSSQYGRGFNETSSGCGKIFRRLIDARRTGGNCSVLVHIRNRVLRVGLVVPADAPSGGDHGHRGIRAHGLQTRVRVQRYWERRSPSSGPASCAG